MNNSSIFVSKTGIGILAVLLFIAVYTGSYFAVTIFAVLLVLFLCAPLLARLSCENVSAGLKRDVCLFPGETAKIEVEIENKKLLPVVTADAEFSERFSASASWLGPYEKLVCSSIYTGEKRGITKTENIRIGVSDPFGLAKHVVLTASENANCIVVYPKIISVNCTVLLNRMSELEASANGFYTDKTLINSVAPYSDGMPYKDINRRMQARSDELFVNVYEKLSMRRVCLVLDFESFVSRKESVGPNGISVLSSKDEENFELMLSAAASLAIELSKKDVILTIAVPSFGGKAEKLIVPENTEEQAGLILRALAAVEYATEETALPMAVLSEDAYRLGKIFAFTAEGKSTLFSREESDFLDIECISLHDVTV